MDVKSASSPPEVFHLVPRHDPFHDNDPLHEELGVRPLPSASWCPSEASTSTSGYKALMVTTGPRDWTGYLQERLKGYHKQYSKFFCTAPEHASPNVTVIWPVSFQVMGN